MKQWLGVQKHGVSDAALFHPFMLNTKMPSQLYKEAHAGTDALIRSKGDILIKHAVNSILEREAGWSKKYSTITHMHKMWQENLDQNTIQTPPEDKTYVTPLTINQAKKAMLKSVKKEALDYWNNNINKLTFQGDFGQMLIEEKTNVT